MALSVTLLILWAAAHYGYDHAAALFGGTGARWHYILGAVQSFGLCLMVALACRSWLPRCICLGIAFDESLKFTCGGLRIHDERWFARPGEGLCDAMGVHVYMVGLALVLFFAVIIWSSTREPSAT